MELFADRSERLEKERVGFESRLSGTHRSFTKHTRLFITTTIGEVVRLFELKSRIESFRSTSVTLHREGEDVAGPTTLQRWIAAVNGTGDYTEVVNVIRAYLEDYRFKVGEVVVGEDTLKFPCSYGEYTFMVGFDYDEPAVLGLYNIKMNGWIVCEGYCCDLFNHDTDRITNLSYRSMMRYPTIREYFTMCYSPYHSLYIQLERLGYSVTETIPKVDEYHLNIIDVNRFRILYYIRCGDLTIFPQGIGRNRYLYICKGSMIKTINDLYALPEHDRFRIFYTGPNDIKRITDTIDRFYSTPVELYRGLYESNVHIQTSDSESLAQIRIYRIRGKLETGVKGALENLDGRYPVECYRLSLDGTDTECTLTVTGCYFDMKQHAMTYNAETIFNVHLYPVAPSMMQSGSLVEMLRLTLWFVETMV